MSEKLQKVLARAGQKSRRDIEALIKQGRVNVNGKIAMLGDRIDLTFTTKISIDGRIISLKPVDDERCRMLVYYKPEGELCTRRDPNGRPTVFDRLPYLTHGRWIVVGRLDINTSGILLFTTDGELANCLMHPSCKIEREYVVRVFGKVDKNKQRKLTCGVQLKDGPAAFRRLTFKGGKRINQWYNVTLTEGRHHEVKRLWEAVNIPVNRLIRVRYGDIILPKWLSRGCWTELGLKHINDLRQKVHLSPQYVKNG